VSEQRPTLEDVAGFLSAVHGGPVKDLSPLPGGFWSSAFAYRAGDRELVLRLGTIPEGFEMDRAAMAFSSAALPVPEVLEVGEALGHAYAISARHYGRFLETALPEEAETVGPALTRTLDALRAIPAAPDAPVPWYPPDRSDGQVSWRGQLQDGLVDHPERRVSGWRHTLAGDKTLDRLFRACEARIGSLLGACPERRDLVHGDLLNRNVLLAEDGSRITAVFSWKCSLRGDFLFDVAWCTFWGPWYPGIAATDLWRRMLTSPTVGEDLLVDASARHHVYELQIGASHLGWNAWTGDNEGLRTLAVNLSEVLERGPLPQPARRD
jgi:aminoglycoside phosphotransferase (APT) family kinase protein